MRPVLQIFYDRSCCLRAFIERINNEININVLKKKDLPERIEYFNDFKMADLNLFCFVLFFFLVSFFFFFPS